MKYLAFIFFFCSYNYCLCQCNCTSNDPINNGLVACYPFNGNANDMTAFRHNGVVTGAVLTTDRFGNSNSAYLFDGINDGITISRSTFLEPLSQMSACAWVLKQPSANAWTPIISKRYSIPDPYNSYSMDGGAGISQKWMVNICKGAPGSQRSVFTKSSRPYNVWEFVAMVYDGFSLKMYLNGSLEDSIALSGNIGYSSMDFYIGMNTVYDQFFKGKIDDVRIYSRALSACEVKFLFENCSGELQSRNLVSDSLKVICKGDSLNLSAVEGLLSYDWIPKSSMVNHNTFSPKVSPKEDTKYLLKAWDGVCEYYDSVWVKVITPSISFSRNERICLGDTLQLNISGGKEFKWRRDPSLSDTAVKNPKVNPKETSYYKFSAISNGCEVTDSIRVQVDSPPKLAISSDTSICIGDSIILRAEGGDNYNWYPNKFILGTSSNSPVVFPPYSNVYFIEGTNGKCKSTDSVFIEVIERPTISYSDTTICQGVAFFPSLKDSSHAVNVSWRPGLYLNDSTIFTPLITPYQSTNYLVTVINNKGCVWSDTIHVVVPKVKSDFNFIANPVVYPDLMEVENLSSGERLSFVWKLDGNSFSEEANPTLSIGGIGTYKVKLIVRNAFGCIDSVEKDFTSKESWRLFIPNSFSPNSDGVNDRFVFNIDLSLLNSLKGTIWNRWGEKVYEFDGLTDNWWDGTSGGMACQDGVYFYSALLIDKRNKITNQSGFVTLLR